MEIIPKKVTNLLCKMVIQLFFSFVAHEIQRGGTKFKGDKMQFPYEKIKGGEMFQFLKEKFKKKYKISIGS